VRFGYPTDGLDVDEIVVEVAEEAGTNGEEIIAVGEEGRVLVEDNVLVLWRIMFPWSHHMGPWAHLH